MSAHYNVVVLGAGLAAYQSRDVVAPPVESLAEPGAEEAGRTGDQETHEPNGVTVVFTTHLLRSGHRRIGSLP